MSRAGLPYDAASICLVATYNITCTLLPTILPIHYITHQGRRKRYGRYGYSRTTF